MRNWWLCGKWRECWNSSTFLHKGNTPHPIPLPTADVKYAKWCFCSRSCPWFSSTAAPKALTRTTWLLAQTTILPEEPGMAALQRWFIIFLTLQTAPGLCRRVNEGYYQPEWLCCAGGRAALALLGSHGTATCSGSSPAGSTWHHGPHVPGHCSHSLPSPGHGWTPMKNRKPKKSVNRGWCSPRAVAEAPVRLCSLWSTLGRGTTEPRQTKTDPGPKPLLSTHSANKSSKKFQLLLQIRLLT